MKLRSAVLALCLLTPLTSHANDPALAEALFQEAKQLATAGKFAEACPKFEASYRADKTLGTLLNLADCHEQIGKVATAWAEWNEAIELAKRTGDDRVPYATDRRDKLTARLPKLEVRVKSPVAGLAVFRGDTRIPVGAYNTPIPVDPGKHEITVQRDDAVLDRRSVETSEGQSATVELDLAAIDAAHPAPKTPPGGTGGGSGTDPGADRPMETSSQKTIGFIIAGVGVVGLATAGVLELVAISNKNQADEPDQCVNKYCSPQGLDSADRAKNFAEIGQWVAVGGLVVTAVGVTLILTAPSPQPAKRAGVEVAPWVAPTGGGLSLSGTL
jgi:hypothetical protein